METAHSARKEWDGTHIYNGPGQEITNNAARAFITAIKHELRAGYGFVPFIGAGLSAPSGAPLVHQIRPYLQRCIAYALGIEAAGMRPWNPRTDHWPPFVEEAHRPPTDWLTEAQVAFDNRRRHAPRDPELPVLQEALGAMAEWRSALQYLSRLVRDKRSTGPVAAEILAFDAPDPGVIDAAIREVMKGKRPTLGHRMLATLGGLLRLDIILTTNFDDLLERAFEDARNPLTVFELHLNSNLPPWSALSHQRSLVKLHGNRYSLRADYTLDALPSELDRSRFLEYFLSADGRNQMWDRIKKGNIVGTLPHQNHLLVMGFSASDRRTRSFIEHAWTHLDDSFKVYWLCYSAEDVTNVRDFTREFKDTLRRDRGGTGSNESARIAAWQGSRILRYSHLGLLFLQLYQALRHGLPVSGIIFPSVARLAVPPMPRTKPAPPDGHRADGAALDANPLTEPLAEGVAPSPLPPVIDARARDLRSRIESRLGKLRGAGSQAAKIVAVTSTPEARGITSVCADVFHAREEAGDVCLWLDMNDIASPDDLFESLLDAATYRLGVESPLPVYVALTAFSRAEEIRRLVNATNRDWVIFLNARETPGANLRTVCAAEPERGLNGWLDDDGYLPQFVEFLGALSGPQSPRISILILCRHPAPPAPEPHGPPLIQALVRSGLIDKPEWLLHDAVAFDPGQPIAASIAWTQNDPRKRRFLHALVEMQRTRFLATIWSECVRLPAEAAGTSPLTPRESAQWIDDLEKVGLVRYKPGGFIWLHSPTRNTLRAILGTERGRGEFLKAHPDLAPLLAAWRPTEHVAAIHADLAQWNRRILAASDAPAAVLEAVYHSCRSAEANLGLHTTAGRNDAREMIEAAASLLHTNAFLLQTHGDSRAGCRHLEYVRDDLCQALLAALTRPPGVRVQKAPGPSNRPPDKLVAAIQTLRIRCTEVMRAIAREVGEDGRAYQRQRELRTLLASGSLENKDTTSTAELYRVVSAGAGRGKKHVGRLRLEWLRWWRWNGMLGIASRSYKAARRALLTALFSMTRPDEVARRILGETHEPIDVPDTLVAEDAFRLVQGCRDERLEILGGEIGNWQRLRLEALRLLEQIAAERIQWFSAPRNSGVCAAQVAAVRALIRQAISLVNQLVAHDHSADAHFSPDAMWCKSRLLMHDSICVIMGEEPYRWQNAMRLLADAEGSLRHYDPRRLGTDRAIVELYRAEIRLREAAATPVRQTKAGGDGPATFGEIGRHGAFKPDTSNTALWHVAGDALRLRLFPDTRADQEAFAEGLRKAKALVQDANRFLVRAEDDLLERRRNVWWTTWFMHRKLMAIGMSVWATILETGTPIPFLGLEAAPRASSTAADVLLDDSCRMIRVDAYRLARVVESYADCAKALHFRLLLDRGSLRLPERQTSMRQKIAWALERLEEVVGRRTRWMGESPGRPMAHQGEDQAKKREHDGALDDGIKSYIAEVIGQTKETVAGLANPLAGLFWEPVTQCAPSEQSPTCAAP